MTPNQPQIHFIQLIKPVKDWAICLQTSRLYERGHRILIKAYDRAHAKKLDTQLWEFERISFIPHAVVPTEDAHSNEAGTDASSSEYPVWISEQEASIEGIDTLVVGAPCSIRYMSLFRNILDFAEEYNPQKLQASRERFRMWREKGFKPKYIKAEQVHLL